MHKGDTPIYKKIQNYIFKFSDLLGQGNFSKVYKAHHQITNEVVAIKIVELESLKSKKLEELLYSQIDILKRLNHPNVLKCFEVFSSNRNCYIITEVCNEGDLESRLRKERYFDQYKAEPLIRDIFEGLHYLAENNIIHRDLKVANVFMNKGKAKIADFGFAKITHDKFKDINIGSPIYMSPEGFINNIYGPKSDVWALGVLMFQLLHGETPFSACRTETELKHSLSIPISKKKFRHQLSHQIKEAILRCMEIDQTKRPTMFELVNLPYFRRLQGKEQLKLPLQINAGIHGSAFDLRLRSPSYVDSKMLKSDQPNAKRKISVDKPMFAPPMIKNQSDNHKPTTFVPLPLPQQAHKNFLEVNNEDTNRRDRRAVSTQKMIFLANTGRDLQLERSTEKSKGNVGVTITHFQVLTVPLTFKECVNVLHYGRLIFKFLLTLKITEYNNDNELFKLTKWLMELLAEIQQRIENKQIVYQGDNASLREQKLREVRNEYQKKYRAQLSNFIRPNSSFGEPPQTLEFISTYCYNLYQKYDSLIDFNSKSRSLLMLGHCIIMMCDANKLLTRCVRERSFVPFLSYREIQTFLNLSKEHITFDSYLTYQQKMTNY